MEYFSYLYSLTQWQLINIIGICTPIKLILIVHSFKILLTLSALNNLARFRVLTLIANRYSLPITAPNCVDGEEHWSALRQIQYIHRIVVMRLLFSTLKTNSISALRSAMEAEQMNKILLKTLNNWDVWM